MRNVVYTDVEGRLFRVLLPEDSPDEHVIYGITVGPPDLSSMNLPLALEVRLNNQLLHRGLFTKEDLRKNRHHLIGAIQSALSLDVQKLEEIYFEGSIK